MSISRQAQNHSNQPGTSSRRAWIFDLLVLVVLAAGLYFRTVGLNWDLNEHLHPDERFLTWVTSDLQPVHSISEYFDTANSTLNPNNKGFTFFVYGTFPIFLTRYVGEWMGMTGYGSIHLVGRQLSGLADLLTVFLVYLAASRLYHRRVGLLAAAFSAFAVLQIQLSHYYAVDTFTNFFTFLAIFFAIVILTQKVKPARQVQLPAVERLAESQSGSDPETLAESGWTAARVAVAEYVDTRPQVEPLRTVDILKEMIPYALFGIAVGLAMASKISAFPVALLLPVAATIRLYRLPAEERRHYVVPILMALVVGGVASFVTFRIFQPYAFTGPGFFGIKLNPMWLQTMRDLRAQSTGDVDFPPALQWARRPVWFSLQNVVFWGLGLPLGVLAWSGFAWMGWRILKGEWSRHLLIWGWTLAYFAWQSLSPTKTMRYQLLIYPTLAITAAWAVWALWDKGRQGIRASRRARENGHADAQPVRRRAWVRVVAGVIGVTVLIATAAWAFAFTRIYTRPVTRIAASEWIYQNVPGAMNVKVETGSGTENQPLQYSYGTFLQVGTPFRIAFRPGVDGYLMDLKLEYVLYLGVDSSANAPKNLKIDVSPVSNPDQVLATTVLSDTFLMKGEPLGEPYSVSFNSPVSLKAGEQYYLTLNLMDGQGGLRIMGAPVLSVMQMTDSAIVQQPLPVMVYTLTGQTPYVDQFRAWYTGTVNEISAPHVVDLLAGADPKSLRLSVTGLASSGEMETSTATLTGVFPAGADPRGDDGVFQLDRPLEIVEGNTYSLVLEMPAADGAIALFGSAPAVESTWDDPLPRNLDRVSALDDFHSVYRNRLNFEMYWDDNADKLARFENTLKQADYIFISSNRQWGTTVRVPERYPLTVEYYRSLLGCPPQKDVLWCYRVAQPGMFVGRLGFELVYVAQSDPNLGPVKFNTQFAEEAFTVYDHPKVLVFKKTDQYDPQKVGEILGSVNLAEVMHVTPGQAKGNSVNMLLPDFRWAVQQAGGTWSKLFDTEALQNRYPALTVLIWYLTVALLGLIVYPLVRLAFPGLSDRGYPLSRMAGMLLLSFLVWLPGSFGVPVTRSMITWVILLLVLVGAFLAFFQRKELAQEWKTRRGYFLAVELLFLAFFALDLAVRLGNPDLWHTYKGGERPMDFSFFNAVLKSTTFPPYDPWFAGGYINYYYYGYVIVGTLVKWLGIVPSVAYNLILPTLFTMLVLGAFSLGWNLMKATSPGRETDEPRTSLFRSRSFWIGLAAALGVTVLGNLGTVRMIWYGIMRLVAPGGNIDGMSIFSKLAWTFQGLIRYIKGANLPYGPSDWYWIPSRAIPSPSGNEITEFPAFTFLYGDLHPHMMALPLTVLALAWVLSLILMRSRWGEPDGKHRRLSAVLGFGLGALVVGALRPTNTWDFYTYVVLSIAVLGYVTLKYADPAWGWVKSLDLPWRRMIAAALQVGLFVGLSVLLFKPFADWYNQGYNNFKPWEYGKTPFWSYITHWGLFLFLIVSWMIWETRDWMASTPLSALAKFKPYRGLIQGALLFLGAAAVVLTVSGIRVGWLVAILGVWAAVLMLRPGMPEAKRLVLFLFGTGLVLTLVVEVLVVQGDIGRMNTVFKFYLQTWTFFAIAAAASLGWLLDSFLGWKPRWVAAWQLGLTILVCSAALYPLMAGLDKVRDRMAPAAPHTLDGMAYMPYATYTEDWGTMDLGQDYQAIRWLQENVMGSPVIVEANLRNLYRWGSRMTIYTGLPGVVGWEWHEQQQRTTTAMWVSDRISEIDGFYTTTDAEAAKAFLQKYNVEYIILGQQERGKYAGPGLEKFEKYNGVYWREVYRQADTVIYQVDCGCSPVGSAQ